MSLRSGTRLGPYEIQSPLGTGGMGEVYKARDTRLDRTVAIKVLPEHVASDPDLKQRFEREAKTLAALSHPHICPVYDVGEATLAPSAQRPGPNTVQYLVMEYLQGETLADRLMQGALPIDQALRHAIEMADALDQAHRHGIVHRDLKPGNIMLTKSGAKLLDFGLAKLRPAVQVGQAAATAAPTISTPLTGSGRILGTLQYMAPEQLEGREADVRSDIFALGAIIYEMVTGRRAFEGTTQASLIAAILKDEPRSITALQPMAPLAVDRLVHACLAKDPDERWQTVRDVARELRWIAESGSQTVGAPAVAVSRRRLHVAWGVAAVSTVVAVALAMFALNRGPAAGLPVRFTVATTAGSVNGLALSPDGTQLAFVTGLPPTSQVWVRRLDSADARPLPGTEDARGDPFWSPDGRAVGFFTTTALKTVDLVAGEPPKTACARGCGWGAGGTWNEDGVIVFGRQNGGLLRVAATGGEPSVVTTVDAARGEVAHVYPQFLPDSDRLLFLAVPQISGLGRTLEGDVYVRSLASGAPPLLLLRANRMARHVAPDYLLFGRGDTLMAQPFDVKAVALRGDPVRVLDAALSDVVPGFSTSHQGGLAYVGAGAAVLTEMRWMDRSGAFLGTAGEPGDYHNPVLSSDGTQIAFGRAGDVWILDTLSGRERRFTLDPAADNYPIWSPDGSEIVFTSVREGHPDLYTKPTAGTQPEQLLWRSEFPKTPFGWSADGRFVSFIEVHPERSYDLWLLPMFGDRQATSFRQTRSYEAAGVLSPDGRWMAYHSDEFGPMQVYVQSVPPSGDPLQVSTAGGTRPRWRRDGRELYYVSPTNELMAVNVKATADALDFGVPHPLFQVPFRQTPIQRNVFDVTADGQRFLVNALVEGSLSGSITWVLNWIADLKR